MKIVLRPGASNAFGPVLKLAREQSRQKITQDDVAARMTTLGLPMDRSAISRIENQSRGLSDIELVYFMKALRLSPEKFIYLMARIPTTVDLYPELEDEDDALQIRVAEDGPRK